MNYKTIPPDSRGHGRSDNPTGQFSYPLMAADIALLIQALGLNQPFVAGYSDGGQVALEIALILFVHSCVFHLQMVSYWGYIVAMAY